MAHFKGTVRRGRTITRGFDKRLETSYPFFNASRALGYYPAIDVVELCPQLRELKNSFVRGTCEAYLEWLSLVESGDETALKFHDLYEPLILLFERGGAIRRRHGEIITGGYVFPVATAEYMSKWAPMDISDEGLRKWANS